MPVLIREIRTGIDPVAVNAVSNNEAWVDNELSDSVSLVSVSSGVTVATPECKDEPGDVVSAGAKAFISCARNNGVRIFDVATRQELSGNGAQSCASCHIDGERDGDALRDADETLPYPALPVDGAMSRGCFQLSQP